MLENNNVIQLVGENLFKKDVGICLENAKQLISLPVQGIKAWKSDIYYIYIWKNNKILILELPTLSQESFVGISPTENMPHNKYELSFENRIVNVFSHFESGVFALDSNGSVYSVNTTSTRTNDLKDHMEVEDIFDSSPTSEQNKKWVESLMKKFDCDTLIAACLMSANIAALVCKDDCLMCLMFQVPEFKLEAVVNLEPFCAQNDKLKLEESVLSSCSIASLSPSLKELFKDHLNVLNRNIVVVGLPSGMVLWFSPESPENGPFVLCCSYLQIQAIHWITDGETVAYLAIVMCSGRVIVFGNRQQTTLSLPDNVVTSCSYIGGIVASNRVDCYSCHIQYETEHSLDCVLMPLKGVCGFTSILDSSLMLAVTAHGSLYCFNPAAAAPTQKCSQFIIPPQTILDTMLTQTQSLEQVYKQMSLEDELVKAVSTASVANSLPSLFSVKIHVLSDNEFGVLVKTSDLRFSLELWMVCVEVVRSGGTSDTSMMRLKRDLAEDSELAVTVRHKLYVGDVVRLQLLCNAQQQTPVLTVPLPEITIDPSYLLCSTITTNQSTSEESLKEILSSLNNETAKTKPHSCKVSLKIPDGFDLNSLFPTVLKNCKHRISDQEWDKLEGGKKFSVKLYLLKESVILNLHPNSRELNIDCSSVLLCHQLKEIILKNVNNTKDKHLSEDLVLDIQGLYQQFEIEIMKDRPDMELLDSYRSKLRMSVSSLFPA